LLTPAIRICILRENEGRKRQCDEQERGERAGYFIFHCWQTSPSLVWGTGSTRDADATETATEAGFCIVLDEPKGGKVVALKT